MVPILINVIEGFQDHMAAPALTIWRFVSTEKNGRRFLHSVTLPTQESGPSVIYKLSQYASRSRCSPVRIFYTEVVYIVTLSNVGILIPVKHL